MKRLFIVAMALSAITLSAPSFAQDWSGIYGGLNGGGDFGRTNWKYTPGGANASHDTSGALFGATLGYNWQFNHVVLGLEGDGDIAEIDGGTACPNPAFRCQSEIEGLETARGRVGWAWGPLLLYGTGGLALGEVTAQTYHSSGVVPPSGTEINGATDTHLGWTGGVGAEYKLAANWSVKAEWAYYDLDSRVSPVDNGLHVRTSENGQLFKIGINYHFGAPPPPPPPVTPMPAAAPAPAPMAQARTFLVFFDFDRYNLTPDARRVVDAAAASYKATGSARVEVSGYTDLAGTQAYNLRLSQRRADTVARGLAAQGVPRGAMDVKWFGKEHPRVPTPDGVREPQNRRVEIVMP